MEEAILLDLAEVAVSWDRLHDPQSSGDLNAEGILELARAAGYDEDIAQKMASERGLLRQRLGLDA